MPLKEQDVAYIEQTKTKVSTVVEQLCVKIDDLGIIRNLDDQDQTLAEMFRSDLMDYMLYLAISDGGIVQEEVDAINLLLDFDLTIESAQARAVSAGVEAEDYCTKAPTSFQLLCTCTREVFGQDMGEGLFAVYSNIANAILDVDGDVADEEYLAGKRYLDTLADYVRSY